MWQAFFMQESILWSMWSMIILWRTSILSIKYKSRTLWYPHSNRNWKEEIRLNRAKIYRGKIEWTFQTNYIYGRMEIFYKIYISCLELASYLGLKLKLAMRNPIKVGIRRIVKWKEEKLCDTSRSSNNFQLNLLTSSVHITQLFANIMMYKEQEFTSHANNIQQISPFW